MRRMINNITYEFPDFFYSWKFKEAKYKLRDLYVRVYVDYKQETPFVLVKIPKSPVYQYLITGNKRVYEDYHDFVRNEINENDRHSTKNFTLLINELKEKGTKEGGNFAEYEVIEWETTDEVIKEFTKIGFRVNSISDFTYPCNGIQVVMVKK